MMSENGINAGQQALLFTSWSGLSESDKDRVMRRLNLENDPFRQNLLDTFLAMGAQEQLIAFEDGFKANEWKLMALVVQSLPDSALGGPLDSSSLAMELKHAFANRVRINQSLNDTMIEEFPFHYAEQKLIFGRSDCFREALKASELSFNIRALPFFHTYRSMAYYAGVMLNLLDEDRNKDFIDLLLTSTGHMGSGLARFRPDVDSFFRGFDDGLNHDGLLSMGAHIMGKERLADTIATLFMDAYLSHQPIEHTLMLMQLAGIPDVISRMEERLRSEDKGDWHFFASNICMVLNRNYKLGTKLDDVRSAAEAICDIYVRNSGPLSSNLTGDRHIHNRIDRKNPFLSVFTSKEALQSLIDQAFKELIRFREMGEPAGTSRVDFDSQSISDKLDALIMMAEIEDNMVMPPAVFPMCELTVRCVALSGARHPEFLENLSENSNLHLVNKMVELNTSPDSRVLLKLGMIKKDRALDMGLGL